MLENKTKQELTTLISKIFNIPLNEAMKINKSDALEILNAVINEEPIEEIEIKGEYIKVTEKPHVLKKLLEAEIEKEEIQKLTDDTLVEIMNLTPGRFIFRTPKVPEVIFELHEFGETYKLPLKTLRKILMFHPKVFKEFDIIILDKAAVRALNLEREYAGLNLDTFDLYQILSLRPAEIVKTISSFPINVKKNIGLRVQQLAFSGQIYDLNVLRAVEEATGVTIITNIESGRKYLV